MKNLNASDQRWDCVFAIYNEVAKTQEYSFFLKKFNMVGMFRIFWCADVKNNF